MSTLAPTKTESLPSGVFVNGIAVGDFEIRSGVSKGGKAYQLVSGKVLAGTTFVTVTQSIPAGQAPYAPKDREPVLAEVVPGFKANNVLALDVRLSKGTK